MSEITPTASAACWNCAQTLKPGAEQCVFCGVSQRQQPTAYVVSPDGMDAAAPPVQTWTPAADTAAPATSRTALDPSISGTAAGVGSQLAAFTVDVVVVAAVAVTVYLVSGAAVFAALAVFEMAVGLWVMEARTGATVGKLVLRIRTSRDDAPFSPGIGRALVRRLLTAAGFIVAVVGAWVVVASGAWDRSGRARSWGDIAARTQLVSVPRQDRVKRPVPVAASTVDAMSVDASIVLAAPQVVSTLAKPRAVDEDSVSQSQTGAGARAAVAADHAGPPVPAATSAAPVEPALPESADGTVLLVFDTGQRERFAAPVAVNLGRNPIVTEPGDKLVTVQDPEITVSKTHLRLEHSRGRTWVTDGGSTNGTDLLDDEGGVTTLAAGERVLLDEGVRVRVGNRAFTISLILGGEK
ncbi:hypothetical protein GCM10027413_31960 [Conyzicola nivalis]|uniref:FHA domain-containing protein n=1 Tax=Conyzicola nivalis TaxID=1477021 RepID=A0A916SQR6_9MICO|nr:RDD family protein [Conyzicola nivalis]GGB11732.1 hypothetical protein GCM10010979_27560 [Conyzicola nivalis]